MAQLDKIITLARFIGMSAMASLRHAAEAAMRMMPRRVREMVEADYVMILEKSELVNNLMNNLDTDLIILHHLARGVGCTCDERQYDAIAEIAVRIAKTTASVMEEIRIIMVIVANIASKIPRRAWILRPSTIHSEVYAPLHEALMHAATLSTLMSTLTTVLANLAITRCTAVCSEKRR